MPAGRASVAFAVLALVAVACSAALPGSGSPGSSGPAAEANPDAKFFWELPPGQRSLVPLDEITSGGPPPDGIPPIDDPKFVTPGNVPWLDPKEPVLALEIDGDARAYPLQIMIWHEIVNDTVGDRPVAVTYCPLCNSAIVFERTVHGTETTFGTSGRLYQSDLVMYDRATKSMWPQILGKAVVGPMIGEELTVIPSSLVSFADFRSAFPDGKVLSRDTGHQRRYGENPYERYDMISDPFLFRGKVDPKLPAIARIVGVRTPEGAKGYELAALRNKGEVAAVNDRIGSLDIVVMFKRGTRSALDAPKLADSRDIGATAVFSRSLGGRTLSFRVSDASRITDAETGSTWDLLGRAVGGALEGRQLSKVDKVDTFWFAWAVFVPDAPLWRG